MQTITNNEFLNNLFPSTNQVILDDLNQYIIDFIQRCDYNKMSKVENPQKPSQKFTTKEQVSEVSSDCSRLKHIFDHGIADTEANQFLIQSFGNKNKTNGQKNTDTLKIVAHDSNKFYESMQPVLHNRAIKTEQSEVKSKKVYSKNANLQSKQHNMLTFGPEQFSANTKANIELEKISQKQQNISSQYPNLSKKSKNPQSQIKSTIQMKIMQQKKKRPKLYDIMCKQVGMSEEKVCTLKNQCLNYQLDRFVKKKGLEYLEQNRDRSKRIYTQIKDKTIQNNNKVISKNIKTKQVQPQKNLKQQKSNSQTKLIKHLNYAPQVFPKINKRNSSKKTIFSQGATKTKLHQQKQKSKQKNTFNRSSTKNQIKCNILNDQQQVLGKIVYDKVQNYFNLDKNKADYYTRVKSEQQIDEAWIQYLRTKVDRAHLLLN